jgi:prevent-host-death family protein
MKNNLPGGEPITMLTVTIEEAQNKLTELIHQLAPGEEVIITENQEPVAKLVSQLPKPRPGLRPPPGLGKGFITVVSDDDEHLKDVEEYMP